jgi:DNA/RNA endonuclease YhcR with UshA esterase domain
MRTGYQSFCAALVFGLVACSRPGSPGTISPEQAASRVGQTVTVEGTVSEVHTAQSGSATFIDMGGEYPNEAFTGVIFASDMAAVGDVSDLDGKTVDINGSVRLYRGRPEIVISSRSQIRAQ